MADTASSMLPYAVITITDVSGSSSLAARSTPNPSPCGNRKLSQDDRRLMFVERVDRLGLVDRLDNAVVASFESVTEHGPQGVLVLDDQGFRVGGSWWGQRR